MDSLPTPRRLTRADLEQLYEGYQQNLAQMTPAELMAQATQLGAMIERDQKEQLLSLMRSGWRSSQDEPVLQSTRTGTPSQQPSAGRPGDRGSAASAPPRAPSNPLALLASSSRTGPRLAAKLVLADVRRRARRAAAE